MKKPILTFLVLSVFFLVACKKEKEFENSIDLKVEIPSSEKLLGCWVNRVTEDSIYTLEKADSLKENEYCFQFNEDSVFIERKNIFWCETPPITYADHMGTWTMEDSIIEITVGYWGGLMDYKWQIISVDANYLRLAKIIEEHHQE